MYSIGASITLNDLNIALFYTRHPAMRIVVGSAWACPEWVRPGREHTNISTTVKDKGDEEDSYWHQREPVGVVAG